ncbi:uncharacterized protein L969DRAFT_53729 [Mixia osmundae IAM 14324]|uniref:uncharacterized protein n=1 Tax=Mixia osmundae (strain CBS 9802 / IAM 14324 / JCM 22182 / KY 12970) TaxID=764103 RepID=UPI0004A5545C|nr:uncharacterized protein L969DRAFT_53729 [Mixia osmundae IAM 14324]KEI37230.1 hypothetical protein L969DRAFT_53729 [Mixia osmundae IAM 14324]
MPHAHCLLPASRTEVKTDAAGTTDIKPTVDAKSVEKVNQPEQHRTPADTATTSASQPATVGAYPTEPARPIPDWFKIGWNDQLAQDGDGMLSPVEIRQRNLLSDFLNESFYGTYFHNAAIIFFAVAASHYATVFGGGWGWLFIILAFCATYYSNSISRTRHNARDDISRQIAKTRLFTEFESAGWMNSFLQRFWIIYEPVLSATIVASVDQVLSVSTPGFLDSLRMTTFTLGTKAPYIDHVRTFPDTPEDIVVMDWKVNFTPNDVDDLTVKAAANKVNPKIVLTIRIGKGVAGVSKDIVVENISFTGLLRIRIKLIANFPHAQTVDISFMEPPHIDFVLRPVGFDLSIIPGLHSFIMSQLNATLGPMMYDPNVFTLNLEQMLSGQPADAAIGVLQVTVFQGKGLKGTKVGGGTPDPYVSFSLSQRAEVARTKIKHSTANPHWNETKFLLIKSLADSLTLSVFDYNERRKDSELGIGNFDLKSLEQDPEQEAVSVPLFSEGKERGLVTGDVRYFPVLKAKKLQDGTEEPIPETKTGIVRIMLNQAKELDKSKTTLGQLNPYAKILLNGVEISRSQQLKRTINPIWEHPAEALVTDKGSAMVTVQVCDDRGFTKDPIVGYVNIKLQELMAANAKSNDWFPLNGCASGRARFSAAWKPVMMAGAVSGAGGYTRPLGVLRFHFQNGKDLKNVEALTGGKSDPYMRILHSGIIVARTMVVNNNLNPEWDEIVYVPIHSEKDKLVLECMDYEHNGKDRTLGQTDLDVASLLEEGRDTKRAPWLSKGKLDRNSPLATNNRKTIKGSVSYTVQFFPCANIPVSFEAVENAVDKIKAADQDDNASVIEGPASTTITPNASTRDLAKVAKGAIQPAPDAEAAIKNGIVEDSTIGTADKDSKARDHVEMSRDEILSAPSGVVVFSIIGGQLARKGARLEIACDDAYWPAYSTEPARTTNVTWDEVGEAFIREREFSRVILKLNTAEKDTNDDTYAQFSGDMDTFLGDCLDKPHDFVLTGPNGAFRSTVTIQARYVPVAIQIEPRESVNNCGVLRVDVLDGRDLPAADRNGKSDPYVKFTLNGEDVFKSQIKKKTLSPKWDEDFTVNVQSRVAADFVLKCYDWDMGNADDKLGQAKVDLASLEPFQPSQVTIDLADPKTGKRQGHIRLRLLFRPEFVARSRAATSTFVGGAGRVMTATGGGVLGVGAGVAKGGGSVVKGVGGGVFSGARKVVGIKRKNKDGTIVTEDGAVLDPTQAQAAGLELSDATTRQGSLRLTINSVHGLSEADVKPYVIIRKDGKVYEKSAAVKHSGTEATFKEEPVTIATSANGPCYVELVLLDKHTFKDRQVGQATVDIWQHLQPMADGVRADVSIPTELGAIFEMSLDWSPSAGLGDSVREGSVTPASIKSRSRIGSPFVRRS